MDNSTMMSSNVPAVTSSPRRLEGKVAIITGAASGIGASAAQLFYENGAKVVIADVQDKTGQDLAQKLGQNAKYIHCDISNEEEVINLIDTTISTFGKLDIMYNNAGIVDAQGSILTTKKSDLERLLSVNVVGNFLGAKHAARVMIPQKSGCILFTASAAASIAGLSTTHSYAATKHAIVGLTKNLAAELGEYGIRVNCVSPYAVRTNIGNGSTEFTVEMEAKFSELGNLQGKILKAEDVAKAALYLVSDEAGYVSGLNLVVDGGFSIVNPSWKNAFAAAAKQ